MSLSVDRFHRMLDKTTTITSKDRDRQKLNFIAVIAAIAFAWNSAELITLMLSEVL